MLKYALEHRKALDIVTQRRDLGLRKFELTDEEWDIAGQLRDVLKVSYFWRWLANTVNHYYYFRFSKTPHFSSRAQHQTLQLLFRPWTSLRTG